MRHSTGTIAIAAATLAIASFAEQRLQQAVIEIPRPLDYHTRIAPTGQVLGTLARSIPGTDRSGEVHGTEVRSNIADVDWSMFDTLSIGDRLLVDDLEGPPMEVVVNRHEQHGIDSESYFGQIADIPLSDFMIVRVGDVIYAQFRDYGRDRYVELRYTPSGAYVLREVKADSGDFCQMDTAAQPTQAAVEAIETAAAPQPLGDDAPIGDRGAWVRTIDVLGVYSPAARVGEGGHNAMRALFQACVNDMNTRLSNSLTDTRARLVWTDEMDGYVEDGCRELHRLRTVGDGHLEEAHTLRDYFQADVVVMICEADMYGYDLDTDTCGGDICGVAALLQAGCTSTSCSWTGFTTLQRSCNLVGRTFAHEVGHLLGACHETDDGGGGCSNSFPHPHGKRFSCDLGLCDQYFIDTMAYARSGCYEAVVMPYYSHRDLSYNPGEDDCAFCGPCPSRSIGDSHTHFSAGTIYFYTRDIVAFFRNEHAIKFAKAGYFGLPEGTALSPYPTLSFATTWVTPGGTVVLLEGTFDEISTLTTIDKPMTITTWGNVIEIR